MARRMTSPVLVGRAGTVGRLRAAFEASLAGRPHHVLVGGEAGVGKSRLLLETGRLAERSGARVLVGACVSMGDEGLPFAPYAQIMRTLVARDGAAQVAAVAGRAAGDLARLVPALGELDALPRQELWAETRLHEALLDLFWRYAERDPLVLQLEDLHWADAGTLAATSFLLRAVADVPITLVATFRSDELHRRHPLRAWLAEVTRSAAVERIDVGPLADEDVSSLVHHILGEDLSPPELAEIARRSDGNPFFIEELLAARSEDDRAMPWELRDVLLSRIDALPEPARALLGVAAVGGREVEHGTLAAVTAEPDDAIGPLVHLLVEAGLLVPTRAPDEDDAYAFRHALLREAVYDAMLPTERRRLHRRWGEALAAHEAAASGGAVYALELAHHWREARDERALETSIRAGDAAMESYSFATALREYEEALRLWDGPVGAGVLVDHTDLLERTARAAYLASDWRRAIAACHEAMAELAADDSVRRTGLLTLLARVLWVSGDWAASLGVYEEAVASAPADPPIVRLKALAGLAQVYMLHARFLEARPLCEEAIAGARRIGARDLEGHGLNTLGAVLTDLGETDRAFESIEAALEIALELGIPDDIGRAYVNKPEIEAWSGYPERGFATSLDGMRVAAEWGVANTYGSYIGFGAVNIGFECGRWDDALEVLARADRICGSPGGSVGYRASYLIGLLACRGDDVEQLWDEARRRMLDQPPGPNLGLLFMGRILHAAFAGRHEEARELLWDVVGRLRETDDGIRLADLAQVGSWPVAELGLAARRGGDERGQARAREDMDRLHELATGWVPGVPRPGGRLGDVLDACARQVAVERERMVEADRASAWAAVADGWLRLERPFRAAMASWRQAGAAEREGDRDGAVSALRAAYATADRLGARPLLGQLEVIARRLRVRLGTAGDGPTGGAPRPYGLTPRETEVLAEVAAGRTNREIAGRLFISESTAGVHVSNILGKLGVSTRTEAARIALEQGLAGDAEPAGEDR